MEDKEIALKSISGYALLRGVLFAVPAGLIYSHREKSPLTWMLLIICAIPAVYSLIDILRPEVVLRINKRGIKHEEVMMEWETIATFSTATYHDTESGCSSIHLILNLSNRSYPANINISRLWANEKKIRKWIQMYSSLPVDQGHDYVDV